MAAAKHIQFGCFLELFSGVGRVTRALRRRGFPKSTRSWSSSRRRPPRLRRSYGQLRSVQHPLPKPHQRTVLKHLLRAEMFEHYLAKQFPASKRFSLEGCEALIPGLHALFETGSQRGLRQVFVGMAHRGRLNVLRNLLGKPIGQIGLEMEGKQSKFHVGDVKYHMGHVQNVAYSGGQVEVKVVRNPSNLEAVTPVVLGNVYACQNGLGELSLIHI